MYYLSSYKCSYVTHLSYFRLETGSYVLIFVLSRVCEESDVEMQWLQSKKKCSYDHVEFRTLPKVWNVRKWMLITSHLWLYSTLVWKRTILWWFEASRSLCPRMISCSFQARSALRQKSRTVADRTCPALIAPDVIFVISHVERRSSSRESRWSIYQT